MNVFKVQQGKIHVETIWCESSSPTHAVFIIQTRTKYPTVGTCSKNQLHLGAKSHSLHLEETEACTTVCIPEKYWDWETIIMDGRYEIYLSLYKRTEETTVWP